MPIRASDSRSVCPADPRPPTPDGSLVHVTSLLLLLFADGLQPRELYDELLRLRLGELLVLEAVGVGGVDGESTVARGESGEREAREEGRILEEHARGAAEGEAGERAAASGVGLAQRAQEQRGLVEGALLEQGARVRFGRFGEIGALRGDRRELRGDVCLACSSSRSGEIEGSSGEMRVSPARAVARRPPARGQGREAPRGRAVGRRRSSGARPTC